MLLLSVIVGFVLVSANAIQDGVEGPAGIAGLSDAVVVGELGQPLNVRCMAYGYPPPSINWYRGRKGPMVPFNNVQYEARDNVLHIKKLSIDTLGEYICLTYNGFGKPVDWSITVKAYRIDDFDDSLFLVTRQNEVVTTPRQPQTEATTTIAPEIEVLVYTENKPGSCPSNAVSVSSMESRCRYQCYDDADCPGAGKCCKRGCSQLCLEPTLATSPAPTVISYLPGEQTVRYTKTPKIGFPERDEDKIALTNYWWGETDDRETSITENEFTTTETTESDISSTTGSTTDNGASIITEDLGISDRLDTSSTGDYWWGQTNDRETSITENEFTTTETTESDISSTTESTTDNGASIITEDLGISDRLDTSSTGDYWWGETNDRETSITENEFTTTETTESDISSTTESTTDNGASIITEDLGISARLDTSSTGDYWWGQTNDRETSITENEFTTTETTESDISSTTESTTDNGASITTENLAISDRLDTSSTGGSTDSTTAESSTNYSFESSTTESDETGTTRYTETTEIRESSKSPVPVTTHIVSERRLLAPGSELSLLCEVDGYPLPEVSWFKDFALISSDDRITVEGTHLTVSRANRNDTGVYSCHAFNALNSHYSSVQINVERLFLPPTCEDYPYMSNCNLIVRSKICYNKLFSNFCCKSCVEAGQLDAWGLNAVAGPRHA